MNAQFRRSVTMAKNGNLAKFRRRRLRSFAAGGKTSPYPAGIDGILPLMTAGTGPLQGMAGVYVLDSPQRRDDVLGPASCRLPLKAGVELD